jgi:transaldolase
MYEETGVSKDRILIKLAGTWEGVCLYYICSQILETMSCRHIFLTFLVFIGIQAARILEKEGIQCNITLVFSFLQAAAAAQAGAYLISPFPGRILDWHKKQTGKEGYPPDSDPGVLAVKRMYSYFRKYNYKTICMPASWRPSRGASVEGSDVDEILALAGVDEMTIPEPLLDSLSSLPPGVVTKQCDAVADGASCTDPDFTLTEESYKKYWGADDCGQEKLKEGIDAFTLETEKLIKILIEKF